MAATNMGSFTFSVILSKNFIIFVISIRRYETRDGSTRVEIGEQREIAGERGTVSRGTYSYIVDGVNYVVVYSADENGFVATGAHLPKPVEPLPVETLPVVPVETLPAETVPVETLPVETVPTVILPVEPIVPLQVPDVVLTLPAVGSATTL